MVIQLSLFRCVEELEDIVKKTYRSGAAKEKQGSPGLGYSFIVHSIRGPKDTQYQWIDYVEQDSTNLWLGVGHLTLEGYGCDYVPFLC